MATAVVVLTVEDRPDVASASASGSGPLTQRRGVATLGLTGTVGILRQAGEGPSRICVIMPTDHACMFVVFLDATATTVLACARRGCVQPADG